MRTSLVLAVVAAASAAEAQQTWTNIGTAPPFGNAPWRRIEYDAARDRIVLLNQADQTWMWDGVAWSLAANTSLGLGNIPNGLTFSTSRGLVTTLGSFGRVYEWNGAAWAELLTSGTRPGVSFGASIAYDTLGQRLVVFGGQFSSGTLSNETWELEPSVQLWQRMTTNRTPSPRRYAGMAYHAATRQTLLFGGENSSGVPFGDTWLWDGNFWTQQFPTTSPPADTKIQMSYDSFRRRIVLVSTNPAATWEWDGAQWQQQSPGGGSPAGPGAQAYDSNRDYTLLVTGNATWRYDGPSGFEVFGRGCVGSAGVPTLAPLNFDKPWINSIFDIEVTNLPAASTSTFMILGFDRTSWFGQFNLPLDLTSLGMPTCSLYVRGDLVFTFANVAGRGVFSLAIPNDPQVVGTPFYLQAIVFDRPANTLGATTSAGGATAVRAR